MQPIRIFPKYVMILNYNVKNGMANQERYLRYMNVEFIPALQKREIYMQYDWQVVYSKYETCNRQVEFITERKEALQALFDDPEWDDLETRLFQYAENYSVRVVHYRSNFRV